MRELNKAKRMNDRGTRAFSFVPGLTLEGFFDMTPEVVGLYVLVGGAGLVCIGAAWLEGRLFGGKFSYIADALNGLLKIGLPVGYFALLLRFFTTL
ncbi:hypothetical protein ACFWFO_01655 [Bacillus subtilis]|uniref:hypothetical protein n=1 Tax=Bacillus subtilis TaxID=1423 RepID=UPI0020286DD5|nr:hypothetical protein [Bacillus subtilis]